VCISWAGTQGGPTNASIAVARQLHKVVIPPAPDPEARVLTVKGAPGGASQAIPSGPWTAPPAGIQRRLSEGWAGPRTGGA
jgi:hypothetical protein